MTIVSLNKTWQRYSG